LRLSTSIEGIPAANPPFNIVSHDWIALRDAPGIRRHDSGDRQEVILFLIVGAAKSTEVSKSIASMVYPQNFSLEICFVD